MNEFLLLKKIIMLEKRSHIVHFFNSNNSFIKQCQVFFNGHRINNFYDKFLDLLNSLIDSYVPFKKPRSRFKYPRNIRLLQSKKWKKCKTDPNFKDRYKAVSKATEQSILDFQISKERKLLQKGSNLKNFFNFVNRKLNVKSFVPDLEVNGQTLSENSEKANTFNTFLVPYSQKIMKSLPLSVYLPKTYLIAP